MPLKHQILVIMITSVLHFYILRSVLSACGFERLSRNAYKKKKKDETFVQWLLYTKFKEVIPFGWRLFYYFFCLWNLVCIMACVVLYFISAELSCHIGEKIAVWGNCNFNFAWSTVMCFWEITKR